MEIVTDILRGLLGMIGLIGIAYFFSSDRKNINWMLILKGLALQLVIAILMLKFPPIRIAVDFIVKGFVVMIDSTEESAKFMFGSLADKFSPSSIQSTFTIVHEQLENKVDADGNVLIDTQNLSNSLSGFGFGFAFFVLPTIIFFSALSSLLYYYGILQKVVYGFAVVMKRLMGLSGAESLAAAANVFIGQTEAPLVVKPYLEKMTKSEILCLMTGGMATIAGGVFGAYMGILGGNDPEQLAEFGKHLLTASIISAPAAIVVSKILFPETEKTEADSLEIPKGDIGDNPLDAITKGTTEGLKLAANVGAMIIAFMALVYFANNILEGLGEFLNLNSWIAANTDFKEGLSLQFFMGYAFAPIAWLIGTPNVDIVHMGRLLGEKTILNEFVAYLTLGGMKADGILQDKTVILATYALCGFANIGSIGIQIGGIGGLAPGKRKILSQFGVKALIGGTIAALLTAAIAGMFYNL